MWVNCYRIHQKSLNLIYPFKFYSNFTNKNVSWLHFSWATQYAVILSTDGQQPRCGRRVTHDNILSVGDITKQIWSVDSGNSQIYVHLPNYYCRRLRLARAIMIQFWCPLHPYVFVLWDQYKFSQSRSFFWDSCGCCIEKKYFWIASVNRVLQKFPENQESDFLEMFSEGV